MKQNIVIAQKNKHACIFKAYLIQHAKNADIKQKKQTFSSTFIKHRHKTKTINMHAYIINTHRITLNMLKMMLLQMVPHRFQP